MKISRIAALALLVVPLLLTATGCQPECVDFADCAAKAKADNKEYTCVANVCQPGSPFPADAGTP